jgi:hypothetical protein
MKLRQRAIDYFASLLDSGETVDGAIRKMLYVFSPSVTGETPADTAADGHQHLVEAMVAGEVQHQADTLASSTRETLTEDKMQELVTWWTDLAVFEADRTVPKAIEYGADDLIEIGHALAAVSGKDLEPDEAAEWGIYFYMIGKIGRWTAAVRDGRRPSDDTIFDIKVYATMVQRIRAAGGWPGV